MAHLPIFSATFPANAFILYEVIVSICQLDLIDTGDTLQDWFKVDLDEGPHSPELLRLHYESLNFLANFGTNLIIWSALPVIVLLSLPVKLAGRCSRHCRKAYQKFSDFMYYSAPIRLFLESLLELCICSLIDIQAVSTFCFPFDVSVWCLDELFECRIHIVVQPLIHNNCRSGDVCLLD